MNLCVELIRVLAVGFFKIKIEWKQIKILLNSNTLSCRLDKSETGVGENPLFTNQTNKSPKSLIWIWISIIRAWRFLSLVSISIDIPVVMDGT